MILQECGAIILAAGNSIRMGESKSFLIFDEKLNLTFIEKIVNEYKDFGCSKIVIVVNKNDYEKTLNLVGEYAEIVINDNIEAGRFYSLKIGAQKLINKKFVFFQNIDNPFVNKNILAYIYKQKDEKKYIRPVYNNEGGHPVLLTQSIISQIHCENTIYQNLKDFLKLFDRLNVTLENSDILVNINSKEEYLLKIKNQNI